MDAFSRSARPELWLWLPLPVCVLGFYAVGLLYDGFRLPYDLETGELIPARWRRWLAHDPINLVARYAHNLKKLAGTYIDCGWRDQYRIHYGCRILSRRLREHGIAHVYEEFDGTHSGIDHRMEHSLPFLSRALA